MEGSLCLSILFRQVFEDHSYYFCCCWIHSLVAIPHELGHSDKKSRIRMQYILVTKLCILIDFPYEFHQFIGNGLRYFKFHLFFFYFFFRKPLSYFSWSTGAVEAYGGNLEEMTTPISWIPTQLSFFVSSGCFRCLYTML